MSATMVGEITALQIDDQIQIRSHSGRAMKVHRHRSDHEISDLPTVEGGEKILIKHIRTITSLGDGVNQRLPEWASSPYARPRPFSPLRKSPTGRALRTSDFLTHPRLATAMP